MSPFYALACKVSSLEKMIYRMSKFFINSRSVGCWHPLFNELCSVCSQSTGGEGGGGGGHVWHQENEQLLGVNSYRFSVDWLKYTRVRQSCNWLSSQSSVKSTTTPSAHRPPYLKVCLAARTQSVGVCWCVSEPVWAGVPLVLKDQTWSFEINWTKDAGNNVCMMEQSTAGTSFICSTINIFNVKAAAEVLTMRFKWRWANITKDSMMF